MMLASQLCILRVFGLPAADVSAAVRAAEAEGCQIGRASCRERV